MTTIHLPKPPRGWKAVLWRAPIWFYRLGLGGVFGKRMLLLTHTGRTSGQPRQAVIEIVDFDEKNNIYFAASGFGEKAHWFQNIMQAPHVTIQVGSQKMSAHAERLSIEESEQSLLDYARRHPFALRELSRMLKIPYNGNEESISAMAKVLPIIAFHVQAGNPA